MVLALSHALPAPSLGSSLNIAGEDPKIQFSGGATLRASCGEGHPTVTVISPSSVAAASLASSETAVRIRLQGVSQSCANAPIDEACVADDDEYPALFYCSFRGKARSQEMAPVRAQHKEHVTSSGHLLGVQAFLVCPLPSIVDIQTLDEYSGDGEPVVLTVNVSHYQLAHPGRYQLPYAGVPAGAQISVLDLPARSPPASPPAPGRIGMPTCSAYLASGQTDSGLYQVSAESGQAVLAYCDMTTSDGGPYVLLEVGRNLGTNLRTTAAVLGGTTDEGFPEPPMPLAVGVASRKFSRAAQLALYGAGDPPGLRWGNPQVGASAVHFLYAKNLPVREGSCQSRSHRLSRARFRLPLCLPSLPSPHSASSISATMSQLCATHYPTVLELCADRGRHAVWCMCAHRANAPSSTAVGQSHMERRQPLGQIASH